MTIRYMKTAENLRVRVRDIMSDGMERSAAELAMLAGCPPVQMRSVLSQMIRQGVVHAVRTDPRKNAKIYRFGSPSPAARSDSWWTVEQRSANNAFDAMVRAGRHDD